MGPPLSSILAAVGALGAVLLLIFLIGRAVRVGGWLTRPAGRLLAIEETIALDQRRRLQLIRCENQRFLLLTGGSQDLVIERLPGKEQP
jgi:flagellar protein FliO/FliZ